MDRVERRHDIACTIPDRQRFGERRHARPRAAVKRPLGVASPPKHLWARVRADCPTEHDAALAQCTTQRLEISAGAGAHVEEAQRPAVRREARDRPDDPPHRADVEVAHASVARRDAAKVVGEGGRRHGPNYTYSMPSLPSLPSRLARHIARARLFHAPGGAVVAVSGGADSVALLDLLHGLAPTLGLTLVVAHADHGIASDGRTFGASARRAIRSPVRAGPAPARSGGDGDGRARGAIRVAPRGSTAARRPLPRDRASAGRPDRDDSPAFAAR